MGVSLCRTGARGMGCDVSHVGMMQAECYSASNPRRVEFQAEGPDHAFQVARNEEDGVHVELWEGDELLARMTKSGADIWKLESSLSATLAACETAPISSPAQSGR